MLETAAWGIPEFQSIYKSSIILLEFLVVKNAENAENKKKGEKG